ncbi:uncharacterized protein LOC100212500 isoform X2 [Hydra vulgaris]|uniref:Uncharacterized protein LOC100212500 isoform X2 n=1 Tax=Hydra vulgaris TaxID=6087 RepID=A0ABM4B707_HYDVU
MIKNTKPTSKDLYFNELKSENDQFGNIVFYIEPTQSQLKKEESSIFLWQSRQWELVHINEDKKPKTSFKPSRCKRVFVRRKKSLPAEVEEILYNVEDKLVFCGNIFVYDIIWTSESIKETYLQVFSEKLVRNFQKPNTSCMPIFKNDDFDKTYQSDYDCSFNQSLEYTVGVIAKLTYKVEKILLISEHLYEINQYNFNDVYLKLSYEPVVICTDYYASVQGLTTSHFQVSEKLGKSCEHHILQVTTRRGSYSDLSLSLSEISLIKTLYRKSMLLAKERYSDLPDDVLVIDCLDEIDNSKASFEKSVNVQTSAVNSFDDDFEDIVWNEGLSVFSEKNNNKHAQINKEDQEKEKDMKAKEATNSETIDSNMKTKRKNEKKDENKFQKFVNSLIEKSESFKHFNVEENVLSFNAAQKNEQLHESESAHMVMHFKPIQAQSYNSYPTRKQNKPITPIKNISTNLVSEPKVIPLCNNKILLNTDVSDVFSLTDFNNSAVKNIPENEDPILKSKLVDNNQLVKCNIEISSAREASNLKSNPAVTESFSKKTLPENEILPIKTSCINNEDEKSLKQFVNSLNNFERYHFKHVNVEERSSNNNTGLKNELPEKTICFHKITMCKPVEAKSCVIFSTNKEIQKKTRLPNKTCSLAFEPVIVLCNKNELQNVLPSMIFDFDNLSIKNEPPENETSHSTSFPNNESFFKNTITNEDTSINKISHAQAPHIINLSTEKNACETPGNKNDGKDFSMFISDINILKNKTYPREINTFDVFLESNSEYAINRKNLKNLKKDRNWKIEGWNESNTSEFIVKNVKGNCANNSLNVTSTPTFYTKKTCCLVKEESPITLIENLKILPVNTETEAKMKANAYEAPTEKRNDLTLKKTYSNKDLVSENISFKVNKKMEVDIKNLELLDIKNLELLDIKNLELLDIKNLEDENKEFCSTSDSKNSKNKIENILDIEIHTLQLTNQKPNFLKDSSENATLNNDNGSKHYINLLKDENVGLLKDTNNLKNSEEDIAEKTEENMTKKTLTQSKLALEKIENDNKENQLTEYDIANNTTNFPLKSIEHSQESKDSGDSLHNDIYRSTATKRTSQRNSYFIKLKPPSEPTHLSEACNLDAIQQVETAPSEIVLTKKKSFKSKVKKVFLKLTSSSKYKNKESNFVENNEHYNTLENGNLSSQPFPMSKSLSKHTKDKKLYNKRCNSLDSYINGDSDDFLSSSEEINLRKKKLAHHASTVIKSKDYSPEVVARETELELECVRKLRRKYLSQSQNLSAWNLEHYDSLHAERNMQIGKISVPEVFLTNQKFQSPRSTSVGKLSIPPAFSLEGLNQLGSIVVTDEIEF